MPDRTDDATNDEIVVRLPRAGALILALIALATAVASFDYLFTQLAPWKFRIGRDAGTLGVVWITMMVTACISATALYLFRHPPVAFKASADSIRLYSGTFCSQVTEISWNDVIDVRFGEFAGPGWRHGAAKTKAIEIEFTDGVALPRFGHALARPISAHVYAVALKIIPNVDETMRRLKSFNER